MVTRKTARLLRELASSMAGKISAPREALLNDIIPYILNEIVMRIHYWGENGMMDAIDIMDYFRISMEQFREHLLELCSKAPCAEVYEKFAGPTKMLFTRMYNRVHMDRMGARRRRDTSETEVKDKVDPMFMEWLEDGEEPTPGHPSENEGGDPQQQPSDEGSGTRRGNTEGRRGMPAARGRRATRRGRKRGSG